MPSARPAFIGLKPSSAKMHPRRYARLLLDIYRAPLGFRIINIALPELDVDYGDGKDDNDRGVTIVVVEYPAASLLVLTPRCFPYSLIHVNRSWMWPLLRTSRDSNSRSRKKVLRISASKERTCELSGKRGIPYILKYITSGRWIPRGTCFISAGIESRIDCITPRRDIIFTVTDIKYTY